MEQEKLKYINKMEEEIRRLNELIKSYENDDRESDAYDEGYEAGHSEGYDEGVSKASEEAFNMGIKALYNEVKSKIGDIIKTSESISGEKIITIDEVFDALESAKEGKLI